MLFQMSCGEMWGLPCPPAGHVACRLGQTSLKIWEEELLLCCLGNQLGSWGQKGTVAQPRNMALPWVEKNRASSESSSPLRSYCSLLPLLQLTADSAHPALPYLSLDIMGVSPATQGNRPAGLDVTRAKPRPREAPDIRGRSIN